MMRKALKLGPIEACMLRNQAAFIAGKAQALSTAATAGAAKAAAQAGVSQAYTMFGSASRDIVGYNEQLAKLVLNALLRTTTPQALVRLVRPIQIHK